MKTHQLLSLCRVYGRFWPTKKKEQVQFTSLLSIGTHIRMTLVCFFLSHLLVKYRIKYPNHQGTKKFRSRVTIEKDFACDCFLTNATPPFGINVKQSGQYFEFQQLKKKKLSDIQSCFHKPLSTGTAH